MKRFFITLLVFFVVFGSVLSGAWAWSAPQALPAPQAEISAVSGETKLLRGGQELELKIGDRLEEKDKIRVGLTGECEINFYNQAATRLGPNTEVSFESLSLDQNNHSKFKIGLSVAVGRAWSRIIQLADQEASFEIESSDTVATVRGTTFDFEVRPDGQTAVSAIEDVVEVAAIEIKEEADEQTGEVKKIKEIISKINLPAGLEAAINKEAEKKELEMAAVKEELKNSEWFKNNQEADKILEEEMKKKKEEALKDLAGILPDSPLYNLKAAAEKTRAVLTFNEDEKEKLEATFLSRRLAEAQELGRIGKAALAEGLTQEIKDGMDRLFGPAGAELINNQEMAEMKEMIRGQLDMQKNILSDVGPNNDIYGLKERLEEMKLATAETEAEKEFIRFKEMGERLKELDNLKKDEGKEVYEAQLEKIQKIKKEVKELDPDLKEMMMLKELMVNNKEKIQNLIERADTAQPGEIKNMIQRMMETGQVPDMGVNQGAPGALVPPSEALMIPREALDVPENFIKEMDAYQLPVGTSPPLFSPTPGVPVPSSSMLLPPIDDSGSSPPPPLPTEINQPGATIIKPTALKVVADKYDLLAGATKQFRALLIMGDGSSRDVTGFAQWFLEGDIGQISPSGLLQSDADGGKGFVNAKIEHEGLSLSGRSEEITALTIGL